MQNEKRTTMNFEKEILAGFQRLGKSPRGNQVHDIDQVLSAYLIEGKTNVVLSAPTGAGKSIIGAVVADVLHEIMDIPERLASFILVGTNMLATQYQETFDGIRDFIQVKGSNNYECEALSTKFVPETADNCCRTDMKRSKKPELEQLVDKFCGKCEFNRLKQLKHITRHVITNYSYFFIDRLFANQHAYRTVTVWDEAHTINNAFAEHCAVFISDKRIDNIIQEVSENLKIVTDLDIFGFFKRLKNDISEGKITDKNYWERLQELHKIYKLIEANFKQKAESVLTQDLKEYSKLNKIGKKYGDLACKIGDLVAYEYEHIFELNIEAKELSVKPIFAGKMFEQLINSQFQLFMSATCDDVSLIKMLNLDQTETAFIKLPPIFAKENKKIIFCNVAKLNYNTLKEKPVRDKLITACNKIVKSHCANNENGIILTPSFEITELITNGLNNLKTVKIFSHQRGQKLNDLVKSFKDEQSLKILISPSMFEGLSLDDDLSRFQIFIKTPYASLGDKRTQYIAKNHSDVYSLETIVKMVQGAGRSVRSSEDWAKTYFLDETSKWLWGNKLNVWQDEFSVNYSSIWFS